MLIATPCVNASVALYICAAANPTCASWVNWRPQLTFSFSHCSRTFRESRTKDPSVWSCVGSFAHNASKSMRAAEGRGDSRNSEKFRSNLYVPSLLLRKSLKCGQWSIKCHSESNTQTPRFKQCISFSAVTKPTFANKYALESSRRDLHNALLCTVLVHRSRGI